MMKSRYLILVATALIALAALNFLVSRHPFRADLTEKRIYTLAPATEKILAGLEDVATVRVYFTEAMPPALEPLRRDVDDLLAEFKRVAGGRLQVEHVDPSSSAMEAQRAELAGIPTVQLNVFNRDKQEVAKIYLGLAVMYGDRQQVIPVVQETGSLEYQIAEALLKVSTLELPRLAWWEPAGLAPGSGFALMRELLGRRYEVATVGEKDLVELTPQRFAAVVLATPRELSDAELAALDQYVMNGGRLVALVDRWDVGPQLTLSPVATPAVDLVSAYGVTVEDALVLDEQNSMAAFSGGPVTYHIPYPYWPEVRQSGFDPAEPITASLQTATFPWTSPLELAAAVQEAGRGQALAQSTPQAAAIAGKDAKLDPQEAANALRASARGARTIAAIIDGPLPSFFAQAGRTPPRGATLLMESVPQARLFVAGSSRWVSDNFLRQFPQNAALFQNVVDDFAMGDALIGIRAREETNRPIAEMPDAARAFLKYVNIAAGPLALGIIGIAAFAVRRRHRRAAVRAYGPAA